MKALKRIAIGAVVVVAVVVAAAWFWLPTINVPLPEALASRLPDWFAMPRADAATVNPRLIVPDGYEITLFARDLPEARMLRVTASDDLLVVSAASGRVYWLSSDDDGDGRSDERRVLLDGLDGPNGLDLWHEYLYIAERGQIGRVRFDDANGRIEGSYEVVISNLPKTGSHWRKTIRFSPDGFLYLTIGSSCNACLEDDERRAAMLRFMPDGQFVDIFATGLRNSAGFDWRGDGTLFATDNGRDLLGDDFPPCELDLIEEGGFYGWPFANGARVPDPDLGGGRDAVITASIPPVFDFRAHNAPLGMVFLKSERQTAEFRNAALVALHGSWNRSRKDGYKVVALHWDADGAIRSSDFVTGFLVDEHVIGRPAELAEDSGGQIYVSDDYANAIYRIAPVGLATVDVGTGPGATIAPSGVAAETANARTLRGAAGA
ncbi:MAG TPA: PQQ-dependent sugar dehydrogenase [Pseudomonadales bacterium]